MPHLCAAASAAGVFLVYVESETKNVSRTNRIALQGYQLANASRADGGWVADWELWEFETRIAGLTEQQLECVSEPWSLSSTKTPGATQKKSHIQQLALAWQCKNANRSSSELKYYATHAKINYLHDFMIMKLIFQTILIFVFLQKATSLHFYGQIHEQKNYYYNMQLNSNFPISFHRKPRIERYEFISNRQSYWLTIFLSFFVFKLS